MIDSVTVYVSEREPDDEELLTREEWRQEAAMQHKCPCWEEGYGYTGLHRHEPGHEWYIACTLDAKPRNLPPDKSIYVVLDDLSTVWGIRRVVGTGKVGAARYGTHLVELRDEIQRALAEAYRLTPGSY